MQKKDLCENIIPLFLCGYALAGINSAILRCSSQAISAYAKYAFVHLLRCALSCEISASRAMPRASKCFGVPRGAAARVGRGRVGQKSSFSDREAYLRTSEGENGKSKQKLV